MTSFTGDKAAILKDLDPGFVALAPKLDEKVADAECKRTDVSRAKAEVKKARESAAEAGKDDPAAAAAVKSAEEKLKDSAAKYKSSEAAVKAGITEAAASAGMSEGAVVSTLKMCKVTLPLIPMSSTIFSSQRSLRFARSNRSEGCRQC